MTAKNDMEVKQLEYLTSLLKRQQNDSWIREASFTFDKLQIIKDVLNAFPFISDGMITIQWEFNKYFQKKGRRESVYIHNIFKVEVYRLSFPFKDMKLKKLI